MTDIRRVPIRVRERSIPQTASPQEWRTDPLRTFAQYVEELGRAENSTLRRNLAVDDLVRMARNALANDLVNRISDQRSQQSG